MHLSPSAREFRLLLNELATSALRRMFCSDEGASCVTATMATEDGQRVLSLRSEVQDSGSVMVSVADTGKGVEPSAIDRIFNPLFTTKAHGMGMGLAICRSIIDAHGGRLWMTANLPRGAIFHFSVPTHPDSAS